MIEIWCEGDPKHDYTACHLGYGKGKTLDESCEDLASNNPYFNKIYNRDSRTYWGCKVYGSEQEARERYG